MMNIDISLKPSGGGYNLFDIPGLIILADPAEQIRSSGSGVGDRFNSNTMLNLIESPTYLSGELITNGDFRSGLSHWSTLGPWQITSGKLNINIPGSTSIIEQNVNLGSDKLYRIDLVIPEFSGESLLLKFNDNEIYLLRKSGNFTTYFNTTEVVSRVSLSADNCSASVSEISVHEVSFSDYALFSDGMQNNQLPANNSFYYDGISNKIAWQNTPSVSTNSFIAGVWIKTNTPVPLQNTVEILSRGLTNQFITINSSGQPGFYIWSGGTRIATIPVNICDNKWHLLVLVHNHDGDTYLVLDNEYVSATQNAALGSLSNSENLTLGSYPNGRFYEGQTGLFFYSVQNVADPTTQLSQNDVTNIINFIHESCVSYYV